MNDNLTAPAPRKTMHCPRCERHQYVDEKAPMASTCAKCLETLRQLASMASFDRTLAMNRHVDLATRSSLDS